MTERVVTVGRSILLSFPFDKALVEGVKQLGSGKFSAETKAWSFPKASAESLLPFIETNRFGGDVAKLKELAENTQQVQLHNGGVRVLVGRGAAFPKTIPSQKAGSWILVPINYASHVIAWADGCQKSVDPALRERAEGLLAREASNYQLGTATEAPHQRIIGLTSTPLPLQWVPAAAAENTDALLIGDDTGLGKTLEALMVTRRASAPARRMLIICPDNLTDNWDTELVTHFEPGTFTSMIATSQTPWAPAADVDTVIIGWTILQHWAGQLSDWKPDFLVVDEGHFSKSGSVVTKKVEKEDPNEPAERKKVGGSYRADAQIKLSKQVQRDGGKVLLLTGTSVVNRPLELLAILESLGLEGYFGGSMAFKMRHCGPKETYIGAGKGYQGTGYVMNFLGASNLVELNSRLLCSGAYIRRTKKLLVQAGTMPPKVIDGVDTYDYHSRPQPKLLVGDPVAMQEYRQYEEEMEDYFTSFAIDYANKNNMGVTTQKVNKAVSAEGHKQLEKLTHLRKLAGIAAVPEIVALAKRYIAAGEKVCIAAHHRDVQDAFAEALEGSVKIQGGMKTRDIEESKRLFNSAGMDYPVIVLSAESAKAGHTLCKQPDQTCRTMIFAEPIWVPGDRRQVEDRIWRIGQNRPVEVVTAFVPNTAAEQVYNTCQAKMPVINAILDAIDPDAVDMTQKAGASILASTLFASGMARKAT